MEGNEGKSREITDVTQLEDFKGWEQFSSEEDFFSLAGDDESVSTEAADIVAQATTEEGDEEDPSKGGKNTPAEEDFFSTVDDEEDEPGTPGTTTSEDEEDEDEDGQPQTSTTIGTLNFLKEKGLVDFELEEDQELTEELAEELIEDKFEESVDNRVKELLTDLPPAAQQLTQYLLKGGDFSTFISTVAKAGNTVIDDNIDLEQESNQELIIRETIKAEGYDSEYIEAQVKFLKDSGMLKATSEKKYAKLKEEKDAQKAALVEQQEQAQIAQKEALKKAKKSVSSFLTENDEIGELAINKEDKRKLPSYMNDKNVKLQNGAVITELEKDLFYDLRQNEEAYMQLALMMRNRNQDGTFNFESIIRDAKTKVAQKVKDDVRRSKSGTPNKSKSTKPKRNLSLADIFNN